MVPSESDEPRPSKVTEVRVCVKTSGPALAFGRPFGRVVDDEVLVDDDELVLVLDVEVALLGLVLDVLVVLEDVVVELLDVEVLVTLEDVVVVDPEAGFTVTRTTSEFHAHTSSRTHKVTSKVPACVKACATSAPLIAGLPSPMIQMWASTEPSGS
jgi:hypothetical protein